MSIPPYDALPLVPAPRSAVLTHADQLPNLGALLVAKDNTPDATLAAALRSALAVAEAGFWRRSREHSSNALKRLLADAERGIRGLGPTGRGGRRAGFLIQASDYPSLTEG